MDPDFAQRRRLAVALAITVIAVPAAFLLNRGNDGAADAPPVTLIGTVPGDPAAADPSDPSDPDASDDSDGSDAPSATDAMGTTPVGFLDGTVVPTADDPATIAIPRLPQAIEGTASFRRNITDAAACQAKGVPFNARITVTNLDNSRSVQCIASVGGPSPATDVVLHADAFLQIADITDVPVPVQITW